MAAWAMAMAMATVAPLQRWDCINFSFELKWLDVKMDSIAVKYTFLQLENWICHFFSFEPVDTILTSDQLHDVSFILVCACESICLEFLWVFVCVRRRLFCCCFHSLLNNNHRTIDEFNTVSVEHWDFDFDFLDLTSFNELVFFPFKWNWLKRWIIHWYWLWFQTVMLVFDFFFFSFAVSLRFYSFLISTIALFHLSFRQTLFVCSGTHWANGLRF